MVEGGLLPQSTESSSASTTMGILSLGTAHHDGQDQLFEVVVKLLVSTIARQFMQ